MKWIKKKIHKYANFTHVEYADSTLLILLKNLKSTLDFGVSHGSTVNHFESGEGLTTMNLVKRGGGAHVHVC